LKEPSLSINNDQYHSFLNLNMIGNQERIYDDEKILIELENESLNIKNKLQNSVSFSIHLKEKFKEIIRLNQLTKKNEFTKEELTIKGSNYMLVITSANVKNDVLHDKLSISNFKGYLFIQ